MQVKSEHEPTPETEMTSQQIEAIVTSKTNALDRRYMARDLTEAQYRCKLAALDRWAERAFRLAPATA